jgi:hypothetical protein
MSSSTPAGVASDAKQQPLDDDFKRSPAEVSDAVDEKSVRVGETEVDDLFEPLRGVEAYDGGPILTVRAVATGAYSALLWIALTSTWVRWFLWQKSGYTRCPDDFPKTTG